MRPPRRVRGGGQRPPPRPLPPLIMKLLPVASACRSNNFMINGRGQPGRAGRAGGPCGGRVARSGDFDRGFDQVGGQRGLRGQPAG
ncbi:hypothetical protein D7193_09430 [Micromonospora costi]|uniref:Uncharacterized protein n=1 Tax=Micromonospora costi TaxID=1530042 RepID=A0A3B0AHR4_9ACTN|nr:hypothetical protein D7193_09430 [Micromonospora costi]